MSRSALLILILVSASYASAQTPASTVTPTLDSEQLTKDLSTPEGPSFFAPKTEEDIMAMAALPEGDTSDLSEE